MGEILSVDMRLNDTRRERAAAARRAAAQSANLAEQIQVLQVQVQDYENEVRPPPPPPNTHQVTPPLVTSPPPAMPS